MIETLTLLILLIPFGVFLFHSFLLLTVGPDKRELSGYINSLFIGLCFLFSIIVIFNSVALSIVGFNRFTMNFSPTNELALDSFFAILSGNIMGIFIICVAAGETALALAMVLALGKFKSTVELDDLSEMKN